MNIPISLLKQLDKEFQFKMVLLEPGAHILDTSWDSPCFIVCQSGKPDRYDWLRKAKIESEKGNTIVCLIPSRTDTRYWHDFCLKANEIRFLTHRLKFEGYDGYTPFSSVLIIFKPEKCSQPLIKSYTVIKEDKHHE